MTPIRLCVVGADGRMGQEVLRAADSGFEVTGAITRSESPNKGKKLRNLGLSEAEVSILGPESLQEVLGDADVYLSFTTPDAELLNLPLAARMRKKIVMGTTGFAPEQMDTLRHVIEGRTEAVFSSNFSIGLNFVGTLVRSVSHLPEGFDASIVEIHHTGKADSPSGTALQLSELVKETRGYTKEVFGRTRNSKRMVPRTQTGWRQGPRP